MTKTEIAKTLFAAKKILEEQGWCEGHLQNAHGKVCAMGALNKVEYGSVYGYRTVGGGTSKETELSDASQYLSAFLRQKYQNPFGASRVYHFNDIMGGSQANVVQWFEEAAQQACEEGKDEQDRDC